jgi:antitoxin (DNA-binding transcriptional repressor) of toxin-antitoxin stability system
MPRMIPLEDAQIRLREVIEGMTPGDEIVIVSGREPVARLIRQERTSWPCQPGSAKDTQHWMAPDFDAPLDDFRPLRVPTATR